MSQCRPGSQDLIPMIDIESTGGLNTEEFCDSLFKFLDLVEKHTAKSRYYTPIQTFTTNILWVKLMVII